MNRNAAIGAAALVAVAAAVVIGRGQTAQPVQMKYRAEEFNRPARVVDAGVLVGFESPCFREARRDPACRELLQRYPDGGR